MKTLIVLSGLAALLVVGAAACTAVSAAGPVPASAQAPAPAKLPAQAAAPALDPIAIARSYVQMANSGDFDKTLAFYADDAIADTGVGVFIGKTQIAKWLATDVKTTRANPTGWQMQGALVVNTGTVSLDRFTRAGINAVQYRSEYLVDKSGKIRFFAPVVTLTPAQQQTMRNAQAGAPLQPAPAANPADVVKAYVEAANSGDFQKAYAFYADDSGALVMNGALLLTSREQIGGWLKDDVKTTRAVISDLQTNGNIVTATGTVSLDRLKNLGIDSVAYRAQYVVENGKIRFFYPTLQFTPEQRAKVQSAQQPQGATTP